MNAAPTVLATNAPQYRITPLMFTTTPKIAGARSVAEPQHLSQPLTDDVNTGLEVERGGHALLDAVDECELLQPISVRTDKCIR